MTEIWHYNIYRCHTAYILKSGTIIYICHKRCMTGTKSLSSHEHSVPKIWHYNIYMSHCVLRYAVAALERRLIDEKWVKQYQIIQIFNNLWEKCGKQGNVRGGVVWMKRTENSSLGFSIFLLSISRVFHLSLSLQFSSLSILSLALFAIFAQIKSQSYPSYKQLSLIFQQFISELSD